MSESLQPTSDPLVLHVIPTPAGRGAQREARALADHLDAPGVRAHRVLTLFDGPPEVRPDFSLRHPGGPNPGTGFDVKLLPKARAALARLEPAVVVAHGGDPLKYLVPAMVGRRRPLAYYAIGTYAGSRDSRLRLALWRRLVGRADVVAAEGVEVGAECVELLGVPPDRVVLAPNGRDPDVFRPLPVGTDRDRQPMLVFVGALTKGKRPDRFVALVERLRTQGVGVRAQIIGDGPLRQELTGPARAAGVDLLGWRPDVAEVLRGADLLVFPSHAVGEGMPGVLIEAGLTGLAVVATDVPGVRTIVCDGETGFVVTVDDFPALVAATDRLLADPSLREQMGSSARLRCITHFSLAAAASHWLELLELLLPRADGEPGRA